MLSLLQGYPTELLPMMVSGVPSMHICLDVIQEVLAQPQTEKQVITSYSPPVHVH